MPETMINNTIVAILYKLVKEQPLAQEERALLDNWLAGSKHKEALLNELKDEDKLFEELKKRYAFDSADEWLKMLQKLRTDSTAVESAPVIFSDQQPQPIAHRVHFLKTSWFRYAAAVIVIAGGTAIWYTNQQNQKDQTKLAVQTKDIGPGGDKAVLTLADGSKIVLDNAHNGNLAQQGNTKIVKLDAGQLAYNTGKAGAGLLNHTGEMLYNTLTTPRGGQYQIVLPDGTKVWLNAASSIKFPTVFVGATRSVEMTGEAYMEIAKNLKQPFTVRANGTEIRVLGTSFNINAYLDEETVKTTLIDGAVKVLTDNKEALLKPGQQAVVGGLQNIQVQEADIDQALAWKNGIFNFNNADIKAMMRQIARWYDVDVQYEGRIPERVFEGKMHRDIPLSSALKILELNKINFRVEGKKIIVMP